MKNMFFSSFAISLLLTLGCNTNNSSPGDNGYVGDDSAVTAFNLNEVKNSIEEKRTQFTQAHITGDTAFLNNIFTDDAKVFAPNSDVIVGRNAIAELNAQWVGFKIKEFHEASTALYGNEEYLIDEGSYFMRYGDDNVTENGKYINVWKNVNGDWKIHSNIWNSSEPVATTK